MENSYNPYHVLGLGRNSDIKQIKERYRELSRTFHPDKHGLDDYQFAKEYFQQIDEAYKIVASPFNVLVFDHFGIEGVKFIINHQKKFETIELEFNKILTQGGLSRDEIRRFIQIIFQKMTHVQELLFEKHLYSTTFQKIDIHPSFQIQGQPNQQFNYIENDQWIAIQPSQQVISHIALPHYRGFDQEVYFFGQHNENLLGAQDMNLEFGHKSFSKHNLNGIGDFKLSTQIGRTKNQIHGNITVEKKLTDQLSASATLKYVNNNVFPGCSFIWTDEEGNRSKVWIGSSGLVKTTLSTSESKGGFAFSLDKGSVTVQKNYLTQNQKYFSLQSGLTAQISERQNHITMILYHNSSFKWKVSKMTVLEISSTVGFGGNQIDFIINRGRSRIHIPFSFDQNPLTIRSLFLALIPSVLPYLWKRRLVKPNWEKHLIKRAKRRPFELNELKKSNQAVVERIVNDQDYKDIIQREQQQRGLIILEAFIGFKKTIYEYNQHKKVDENDQTLIIDCKHQLQVMVTDGYLEIQENTAHQLPGLYLLDQQTKIDEYAGYVSYSYRGKDQTQVWNLTEELRIGDVPRRGGYNLLNWLLRLI